MLFVVCHLSRDIIGYEDSGVVSLVRFDLSIVTLNSRLLLEKLSLVQSFSRSTFCLSPSMSRFKLITK